MAQTYFKELSEATETRFWINNPTGEEIDLAIGHGAIACTTNPAYCSRLISAEPEYLRQLIDETIRETPEIGAAAVEVYRKAASRIMAAFAPLHAGSSGSRGFVTIQDDPNKDEDTAAAVAFAHENRKLGSNFMAKIPVIAGGLEAIEACVEEGIPVCATEVFTVSQARLVCERYESVVRRTGKATPIFITHISGIFDEYLEKVAARDGIPIAPEVMRQAGLAIARKEYALLEKAGTGAVMMGGGARGTHHFTGLAGGKAHITINWSTAREILDSGVRPSKAIDAVTPQRVIDELREKFSDFQIAWDDDGQTLPDFASYGPVQLFRNAFLKGWHLLLAEIAARRNALAR